MTLITSEILSQERIECPGKRWVLEYDSFSGNTETTTALPPESRVTALINTHKNSVTTVVCPLFCADEQNCGAHPKTDLVRIQPKCPYSNDGIIPMKLKNTSLSRLKFSERARSVLQRLRAETVGDLVRLKPTTVRRTKRCGEVTFHEIEKVINGLGIKW